MACHNCSGERVGGRGNGYGRGSCREHRKQQEPVEAAVRAALAVVLDVASQDAYKLLAADDQQLVQTLAADRPDPAFGDGVGPSRQLLVIRKVHQPGCE
jgi:hypothetical protein